MCFFIGMFFHETIDYLCAAIEVNEFVMGNAYFTMHTQRVIHEFWQVYRQTDMQKCFYLIQIHLSSNRLTTIRVVNVQEP